MSLAGSVLQVSIRTVRLVHEQTFLNEWKKSLFKQIFPVSKMTTPEQLLILKFGQIPLFHLGDLTIQTQNLAFYGARVAEKNNIPYNILLVAVPLELDHTTSMSKTIASLPWNVVYLRSYHKLEHLTEQFPLNWTQLANSVPVSPSTAELPDGMWIRSFKSDFRADKKHKMYTLEHAPQYIVTLESRLKDSMVGHNFQNTYELDLLLNFTQYNLAIEKKI